jgi:hypothetical protein
MISAESAVSRAKPADAGRFASLDTGSLRPRVSIYEEGGKEQDTLSNLGRPGQPRVSA